MIKHLYSKKSILLNLIKKLCLHAGNVVIFESLYFVVVVVVAIVVVVAVTALRAICGNLRRFTALKDATTFSTTTFCIKTLGIILKTRQSA
jgi:hypothetical protein